MTAQAVVSGPILTRPFKVLAGVAGLGLLLVVWRFAAGLGAVTGLSDGYPWGLWIAFDVVTGTALACGGYAVAILAYVLNRGRYHPLVRPALLTSALGYTLAGLAVAIDVGRPWWLYRVPLHFWQWNGSSALLEVALCVMAYIVVLWIELSPAFLETWRQSPRPFLRRLAGSVSPFMERALLWIIALGLLLPTMHQSSLGTVLLLAGSKLHPLWQTPLLPLLFLVSCVGMGYAVVVLESTISSQAFRRRTEAEMLTALRIPVAVTLVLFLILRLADVLARGGPALVFGSGWKSGLFGLETGLFLAAVLMLLERRTAPGLGHLFRAAMLVIAAGTLFRFDAYLLAFDPGEGWSYFPALPEILITAGLLSAEVMAYLMLVKTFPILGGAQRRRSL